MKKIYSIVLFTLCCVLAGCNDDLLDSSLTADQRELLGTAVNFEPYVDNFNTTRAEPPKPTGNSNNHEGGFNANDMMYIYRQYWDETTSSWIYKNPPGTIYKYTDLNLGESGVFDKTSWRVYEGKTFKFYDADYTNVESGLYDTSLPAEQQPHSYSKKLEKGDSIIWESGSTVRFRAWALSRMGNTLADKTDEPGVPQNINYPDYMVSDWVTVSGPTQAIPLAMRHLGCRLGFVPRDNNQFVKIEISTDPADYMRDDNAQSDADDAADKHPETSDNPNVLTAAQCAANVADAFDRMCWPAGVDMETLSLLTCSPNEKTKYSYKDIPSSDFIKEKNANGTYKNVKHAQFFSSSDSRYYMVSIPYDMSTREPITLPPYTRFRVWLYDVNKGDGGTNEQTGNSENRYHIFQLSDVKKSGTQEPAFPDGFMMLAGYSATFSVGYHYGHTLEIWAEDSFSWDECPLDPAASEDQHKSTDEPTAFAYSWWTSAIDAACTNAKQGKAYKPDFKISNQNQLLEFSKLVNGDFKTTPIYKKVTITIEPGSKAETHTVEWYTGIGTNGDGSPDTLWISRELLRLNGYVLYNKYTPSIADRPATIEEDYLQAPYNFYDDQVKSRWTVTLNNDIDLKDWKLPTIGSETNPFCGYFDGAGHTLSNLYMTNSVNNGQIFGYAKNGTIANLKVVSTHPVSITGTCENERILGCSVIAPSTKATLANQTKGYCYFVGCFHQGSSSAPLVNDSQDLGFEMYGCMQANDGIASGTAALANITTSETIVGIISEDTELEEIKWGQVSCCYYDTELSPGSVAFHTSSGNLSSFHRLQYIRGSKTHILCAKNDFLVDSKTEWKKLAQERKDELYGVAPWRAMNWGIYMYNSTVREDINRCNMHYEPATTVGYAHLYPELMTGVPSSDQYLNVLEQFN